MIVSILVLPKLQLPLSEKASIPVLPRHQPKPPADVSTQVLPKCQLSPPLNMSSPVQPKLQQPPSAKVSVPLLQIFASHQACIKMRTMICFTTGMNGLMLSSMLNISPDLMIDWNVLGTIFFSNCAGHIIDLILSGKWKYACNPIKVTLLPSTSTSTSLHSLIGSF